MLVSCVCMCRYRPLRPAYHSFRGVPPGVKEKVQFTAKQATKAQRGSRGIALLFH